MKKEFIHHLYINSHISMIYHEVILSLPLFVIYKPDPSKQPVIAGKAITDPLSNKVWKCAKSKIF